MPIHPPRLTCELGLLQVRQFGSRRSRFRRGRVRVLPWKDSSPLPRIACCVGSVGVPRRPHLRDRANFYEWKKTPTGKQPYAIALADRRLMALAGLWETWRSPTGERVRSFRIVTTTPNELCAELHNRMPVVLKPHAWPVWLGEVPAGGAAAQDAAGPLPFR